MTPITFNTVRTPLIIPYPIFPILPKRQTQNIMQGSQGNQIAKPIPNPAFRSSIPQITMNQIKSNQVSSSICTPNFKSSLLLFLNRNVDVDVDVDVIAIDIILGYV
jgi:hypothetical protein